MLDRVRKRCENPFLVIGVPEEPLVDRSGKLAAVTVAGGNCNCQKEVPFCGGLEQESADCFVTLRNQLVDESGEREQEEYSQHVGRQQVLDTNAHCHPNAKNATSQDGVGQRHGHHN